MSITKSSYLEGGEVKVKVLTKSGNDRTIVIGKKGHEIFKEPLRLISGVKEPFRRSF